MLTRLMIQLPADLRAKMEARQAKTGASLSEIVRRALVAYLATQKTK
jgi:metal-responsive CopG/Arc/MetJ family transcriptional regulator